MIVVMLIILSVTALALFSVHSTTSELRASGHLRQAMQAQYVSESGAVSALSLLDNPTWGPRGLLHSMRQTTLSTTLGRPVMAPYEPELTLNQEAYRLFSQDFTTFVGNSPVATDSLGAGTGTRQPYDPFFSVDVTDHYQCTAPIAGQRADGAGRLQFLCATYTARGRMGLRAASFADPRDFSNRGYHEAANDARAYGMSGPYAP